MAEKKKSKPGGKRALTVDDLWAFDRIGAITLSPDGADGVASVTRFGKDDDKAQASLWRLSTRGGAARQLTHCGEKDGQPLWSPTGEAIAFVAQREQQGEKDDTPQLYLIAADGGEARRASRFAPGVEAFKWFPDGKRIAFVAWVWPELEGTKAQTKAYAKWKDRKTTGYVTSEAQYRFWDHSLPMGRVPHLHVLEVETGRITDLFEGMPYELPRADPNATFFDIAPDGRHLAFCFDPAPQKRIDNFRVIVELDLEAMRFETVVADAAWDFDAPSYRPDGEAIAFIASNRRVRQFPRLERLRPGLPRQHHPPLGRARIAGRRGRYRLVAAAALGRQEARLRRRRQLRRLHGRVDERAHRPRPLQRLRLPRRLLRLGGDVQRRRLHLARQGTRRLVLGRRRQGQVAEPERIRGRHEDADARHPRRTRLPRARPAGPGLLQHAEGEGRRRPAALVPGREPLDLEPRNSQQWYAEFFDWLRRHDKPGHGKG